MKSERKHRLLTQVSVITIVIFVVILVFLAVSDYFLTRRVYLSSKNEMIERDLIIERNSLVFETHALCWYVEFLKDHREEVLKEVPEEEQADYSGDEVYMEVYYDILLGKEVDVERLDENQKLDLARSINTLIGTNFSVNNELFYNYGKMRLLEITDEDVFQIAEGSSADAKEIDGITLKPDKEEQAVFTAVKKAGLEESQTFFRTYHDKDNEKVYYIGFTPLMLDGAPKYYLCMYYDWSTFRHELISRMWITVLVGFGVLLVLVALLMLYLYFKAISPVQKVKAGVVDYMENKDSSKVADRMNAITVRNEVGVLANSFRELSEEIDRYTGEILKLNTEKERAAAELDLATKIQANMLPNTFPAFPDRKEFDIYASMDPAKEVGGDFYDFFLIDDDHLAMVIADVSGKGVPAALFMMSAKILINDHALMGGSPAEILDRVNRQICENNEAEMFVTVWLGILEISSGKITACSAGHEYPMLNTKGKYVMFKDKHGLPLGAMDFAKYKDYEIEIKKGDSIFVYTDGVAEATDSQDKLFGTDRTLEALNEEPDADPETVLRKVRVAVDGFVKEAPQFDDLTMLCMKYLGK